jgi:hypothetical protein
VSRNCKTLEQNYHIPTVGGAASNIIRYAQGHDFLYTNGSPIRFISFPFPVAGQPQSVHHKYVFESNDVVSGKPMMRALVDALTVPLTDKEKYKGPAPEPPAEESRFLGPDTEENLQRLFKDKDWTDYLPIVLPTEERVADMLKGTSHKPTEVIKTLDWPGGKREVTVERVATCAVMAGAKREYLPVILALANFVPFGNSTSSMANMIVVNGPIRDEIKMNYGTNVMGPHNEANAVIGRAYTLMSKTIGGLHSEKTTWSSLGSTMQYNNVCIAENEQGLPEGWQPLHVQMGFKPSDSVISVGVGWTYISSVVMAVRDNPANIIMADQMKPLIMGSATVIMDPSVAALLKDSLGFKSKDQLIKWFVENAEKTQSPSGEKTKIFNQTSAVNIVVAGGGIQTTWFVTDFGLAKNSMLGGAVRIDDWR